MAKLKKLTLTSILLKWNIYDMATYTIHTYIDYVCNINIDLLYFHIEVICENSIYVVGSDMIPSSTHSLCLLS